MNQDELYQTMLRHLIWMASKPGAKAHAWHRALEMDKQELFKGIKEELIKQMKEQKGGD